MQRLKALMVYCIQLILSKLPPSPDGPDVRSVDVRLNSLRERSLLQFRDINQ